MRMTRMKLIVKSVEPTTSTTASPTSAMRRPAEAAAAAAGAAGSLALIETPGQIRRGSVQSRHEAEHMPVGTRRSPRTGARAS